MPREVVLPPVEADPLELARRLFPEHRERRGEPAGGAGERKGDRPLESGPVVGDRPEAI